MLGYFRHIKLSTHQGLFSIMLYFVNSLIFIVKFSPLLLFFFSHKGFYIYQVFISLFRISLLCH